MMHAATVQAPTTTWTEFRAMATLAATLMPPASTRRTSAHRLVMVTASDVRTIRATMVSESTVVGVIHYTRRWRSQFSTVRSNYTRGLTGCR